ncbi:MAG: ATP-binding protein, partial [bacterium]
MDLPFIKMNSIFKKLFILTFLIAVVPIGASWLYFLSIGKGISKGNSVYLPFVFEGLFVLAIILATSGAYYFSKKISRPITQFKNSALEIARGNFDHKVSIKSKDEIGQLAKIFDYMTEEFRKLYYESHLTAEWIVKWQIDTIMKYIADGVIITDADNKILRINTVAEKWFDLVGISNEKQPIEKIIKDRRLVKFIQNMSMNGQKSMDTIEITVQPPGSHKPEILQALATRIVNKRTPQDVTAREELIGIATILRNITHEKEIDRLKTELVSMVAHELRSPLTCISGFSELLLDESITHEQLEEYASIILKESNRLSDLINKFLDISKIEAGKSQIRKTPVDLKMLVEKVLDFNSQLSEQKQIKVDFVAPPEVSIISVDRDMLEQVVLNLYANAVKYSPEKTNVTFRLFELDEVMVVEVEDQGYGISEKSLPHIFDKFYRITDNENVKDISGSGLGLSLVKEIVEIHGGKVKVKSTLGKGSNFTITLPKSEQATQEP